MGQRIGNGFIGTSSIQTTTANQEIIPSPPSNLNWTGGYNLYRFEFINDQACTAIINGTTTIYLRAGYGFEIDATDAPISSFVIKEAGITYTFTGGY